MRAWLLRMTICAAFVSSASSPSMAQPAYQGSFTCDCGVPTAFSAAKSIAVASSGQLFTLSDDFVLHHMPDGQFIQAWRASDGAGAGHVTGDVAIQSSGDLLVTDATDLRIIRKSPTGVTLGFVGQVGSGPGQFERPSGVAVGPDDAIYATDVMSHRITKFSAAGDYLMHWSAVGDSRPFLDDSGNVYAVGGVKQVFKYSPTGQLLLSWGGVGTGPGQFGSNSVSIGSTGGALGPDGLLYLSDTNNHRIQVFNTMGIYQYEFGTEGDGSYQFGSLGKPAFDSLGNLYIPDAINQKVHKYGPGPVPTKQSSWGLLKARYR